MGKLAKLPATAPTGLSTSTGPVPTYEGGPGFGRDPKTDLVIFAASNLVSEDTFYEGASERDERFRDLVAEVTVLDPDWVARFVPYLRNELNMRSASIVMAAESVSARHNHGVTGAEISVRRMVDSAISRADEFGEFLGYWRNRFGKLPPGGRRGIRGGVADAIIRLVNEKSALKYDGQRKVWRLGDVIEVTHPRPQMPWQADLFQWLIDRRHGRAGEVSESLPIIRANTALNAIPQSERRAALESWGHEAGERLRQAGMTWETLAGWLNGPMDKLAWEAILPSMGLMAAIRNARNMDQAGVSDSAIKPVLDRLANPEEVRRSRQFPFRYYSAYRNAPSLRWGHALDQALTHATSRVPALPGRTLVLVDTSSSMRDPISKKSTVSHVEVAALFAGALAKRGNDVDLYGFADGVFPHQITKGGSLLSDVRALEARIGEVGHGTRIHESLAATYRGHDRVIVHTDGQTFAPINGYYTWSWSHDDISRPGSDPVPPHIPVFGVNAAGYKSSVLNLSKPGRYEIGGFSDALFAMVNLLSRGQTAAWPF
jgi:TROVE domain